MFASSPFAASRARTPHGSLYQQVGVETRVGAADPHQLVALLFEGYMEALAQARGAMRSDQRESKGLALGRAVRIVEEGLRSSLDLQAGGSLARDLNELYNYLSMRLTMANLRNDEAMLDECQRLMLPLQQAWTAIAPSAASAKGNAR